MTEEAPTPRNSKADQEAVADALVDQLHNTIRTQIARRKIRVADIARNYGCSQVYIFNLLKNKENVSLRVLGKLALAMGLQVTLAFAPIEGWEDRDNDIPGTSGRDLDSIDLDNEIQELLRNFA
ncbi:helix-turn-helix domain-containing protein [Dyella telluris]|uniref:HTH cro/C1-type domain-containing protein n=1 Tax=Dyella telluris TaxID=2763498 RepID=A0A7G8Q4H9_9GAMM|nr:helix-turn-helix domain-containing protein [Dyella telluris]QNK01687.1 hypothetical protein H8F01_00460 [Dyella telluris]